MRQHLVDEVLHAARDRQRVDLLGQRLELLCRRTEALVGRQHFRPLAKELLVTLDYRFRQVAVGLLLW